VIDGGTVAILCGGRGTRLQERTHAIPKALVEIGGKPILWHVVRIYAAQGFQRFLLLTGYLGEAIEEFVAATEWPEPVQIECMDTGLDTPTGGRICLAADRLDGGAFSLTYADGVADIDLAALGAFHRGHGGLATVTVVRPRAQFGVTQLDDDDRVLAFEEKPRLEHWVNGGFFRHTGFWDCMDTYKDAVTLNDLWATGDAPWAIWERSPAADAGAR
jgi:glucose-1-phosphate cytidylyltransferase